MKIIAIDVMGNEHGPKPLIEAVLDFLAVNLDYRVIFVGDAKLINSFVQESEKISILHVDKFIDPAAKAFNSRDFLTSMAVAIKLVRDKKADAVLSCGASAAYLSNVVLLLGRIHNVLRPAFMCVLPTLKPEKRAVLLDCGANISSKPQAIAQWANLAKVFVNVVFEIKNPIVGLVNVGTEESKGLPFHSETNQLLRQNTALNYLGFIEPRKLLHGNIDIILSDGYGGNLLLKTLEDTVLTVVHQLKKSLTKNWRRKVLAMFLKKGLKEAAETFDYRNVGAACVIGVNGLAIKCHGASDKKSFDGALNQIKIQIEKKFLDQLIEQNS